MVSEDSPAGHTYVSKERERNNHQIKLDLMFPTLSLETGERGEGPQHDKQEVHVLTDGPLLTTPRYI